MQSLDPTRLALWLLRERRGLTQLELARRSGVGKARVSSYESGRQQPTLVTLERLLRALGSDRLAFFLLAELLTPAAALLTTAELEQVLGPTAARAAAPSSAEAPTVYAILLGALRSNLETAARLVDALEQSLADNTSLPTCTTPSTPADRSSAP